mgnify:CR=1
MLMDTNFHSVRHGSGKVMIMQFFKKIIQHIANRWDRNDRSKEERSSEMFNSTGNGELRSNNDERMARIEHWLNIQKQALNATKSNADPFHSNSFN